TGLPCRRSSARRCPPRPAPPGDVASAVWRLSVTTSFREPISPTVSRYNIYRATVGLFLPRKCPQYNPGLSSYLMITKTVDPDPSTASSASYSYKDGPGAGLWCYVATAVIDSTGAESDPAPSNPPPITKVTS